MTHKVKIYLGIAAIIVAVILLLIGSLGSSKNSSEMKSFNRDRARENKPNNLNKTED